MNKKEKMALVPRLRFQEFLSEPAWVKDNIGKYLKESRIKGSKGDTAKKITVKLWGNGVFEKQEILKGSENTQYFRRKSGQFIYSKLDFLNQAFGIIPKHLDNYESTVDLPCFDVSEQLDTRFLLEYVQRKDFYKKYGEIADGGRKAKRIQVETFFEFPIYLPKLSEQQKIADCLSSLDDLIRAENEKLLALKDQKKGLMQKLFPAESETVPKWRFPEFKNCEEWEEQTLKTISDMQAGKFINASEIYKELKNKMYPCYGGNGLRGYTKTLTHSGKYSLIGRQGALCGNINYVTGDFYATEHAVVVTARDKIVVRWLYYLLINLNLNQYATGQAQPGLSVQVIEKITVWVPRDPDEQQKIADCLSTLDELITAQAEKIEALKQHKKALIQGLFPSAQEVIE